MRKWPLQRSKFKFCLILEIEEIEEKEGEIWKLGGWKKKKKLMGLRSPRFRDFGGKTLNGPLFPQRLRTNLGDGLTARVCVLYIQFGWLTIKPIPVVVHRAHLHLLRSPPFIFRFSAYVELASAVFFTWRKRNNELGKSLINCSSFWRNSLGLKRWRQSYL